MRTDELKGYAKKAALGLVPLATSSEHAAWKAAVMRHGADSYQTRDAAKAHSRRFG